ncbi:MAG: sodium:proton antiporter [Hyphomicrobiales bacterium]|nr:sodium:proton antiporter [Hyphomicrobiales bacterium]
MGINRTIFAAALALAATTASGTGACAAEAHGLDGASLGAIWAIPFVGILLSIAIFPLAAPHFWHHHFGKVAAAWGLAFAIPFAVAHGVGLTGGEVLHTALLEYLPFVILLWSLFTISGGILVTGNLHGSPRLNLSILGIGTVLASVIGTTGASMVLIRPLLRANDERRHNVHVVIFFIFLVSNIGGSMTPLGDPPLFLGYLKGVGFFWTAMHMVEETAFAAGILLAVFFVVDRWLYHRDEAFKARFDPTPDTRRIGLRGLPNIALLAVVVGGVLLSGTWKPGVSFHVGNVELELQDIARDVILLAAGIVSLLITPKAVREANEFSWGPILEVAKLFAGIFVTIIPVIAMLKAAENGAFAPLVAMVNHADGTPNNAMYFWLTGILSSFLDNAPTYLVFFNLAGGDPQHLMYDIPSTLLGISCGAVFMGANSYIGNAPNFMVKAIAEEAHVKMPSFFGYLLWSGGILIPLFGLVTLVFFHW